MNARAQQAPARISSQISLQGNAKNLARAPVANARQESVKTSAVRVQNSATPVNPPVPNARQDSAKTSVVRAQDSASSANPPVPDARQDSVKTSVVRVQDPATSVNPPVVSPQISAKVPVGNARDSAKALVKDAAQKTVPATAADVQNPVQSLVEGISHISIQAPAANAQEAVKASAGDPQNSADALIGNVRIVPKAPAEKVMVPAQRAQRPLSSFNTGSLPPKPPPAAQENLPPNPPGSTIKSRGNSNVAPLWPNELIPRAGF